MRFLECATVMALVAFPAQAQQSPAQVSAEIKQALAEQEFGQDISVRHYVLGQKLAADGEGRHSFDVRKSATYLAVGVCDDVCQDIDIVVSDAAGNVLGNDETSGADPFVVFSPQKSGRVSVVLTMKECSEDLCEYGLGFYSLADRKETPG